MRCQTDCSPRSASGQLRDPLRARRTRGCPDASHTGLPAPRRRRRESGFEPEGIDNSAPASARSTLPGVRGRVIPAPAGITPKPTIGACPGGRSRTHRCQPVRTTARADPRSTGRPRPLTPRPASPDAPAGDSDQGTRREIVAEDLAAQLREAVAEPGAAGRALCCNLHPRIAMPAKLRDRRSSLRVTRRCNGTQRHLARPKGRGRFGQATFAGEAP